MKLLILFEEIRVVKFASCFIDDESEGKGISKTVYINRYTVYFDGGVLFKL